ncbi:hypothetical protein HGRIS_004247 [Hohenbuehelia grisea]|uniref:Secreted protein n=1 Tax=Hohenbuehelia grisea TaxID=104357 RepID=A0ABR3IP81_9AGAR
MKLLLPSLSFSLFLPGLPSSCASLAVSRPPKSLSPPSPASLALAASLVLSSPHASLVFALDRDTLLVLLRVLNLPFPFGVPKPSAAYAACRAGEAPSPELGAVLAFESLDRLFHFRQTR